jgi:amino acid adenylation domain-containing protein/thioester reductase-like protein
MSNPLSKPAIISGDRTLTAVELENTSNQFAHFFLSLGIQKGDRIGLALDRSIEFVLCILAAKKLGAIYVPIDPSYPDDRKKFIIGDTSPKLIITSKKYKSLSLENALVVEEIDYKSQSHSRIDATCLSQDDILVLHYTSGSTGTPKGVEVTKRNIERLFVDSNWIKISPNDKILHMANTSFDASSFEIWAALFSGATLCIYEDPKVDLEAIVKFLEQKQITLALFTAKFFSLLAETPLNLSKLVLTTVLSGGDVMNVKHTRKFQSFLPNATFINAYGPTENGIISTFYTVPRDPQFSSMPIGKPVDKTQILVLDEHMNPVNDQEIGEICLLGDGLARGYWHRPELTASTFVTHTHGKRIYRTGDLGRLQRDGNLEFCGRKDSQVKIRGFRIEPGEIESVIKSHDSVKDCIVLAKTNPILNEVVLCAYIEPSSSLKIDTIRSYVKTHLPEHMVPSFFIHIDRFEMTPNGKVNTKTFPSPFDDQKDIKIDLRNDLEKKIAEGWREILGIFHCSREDNFFHLGGDSLKAMQFIVWLKSELKIEQINSSLLFSNPILKNFTTAIQSLEKTDLPLITALNEQHGPLSDNQESLWIVSRLNSSSNAYNVSFAFTIQGDLNLEAFISSFNSLLERHKILKTSIIEENLVNIQKLRTKSTEIIFLEAASSLHEAQVILQNYETIPIDVTGASLIYLHIIKTPQSEFAVLIKIHHIIFDGWSSNIFFQEWGEIYKSEIDKKPLTLSALPIQYIDYSRWLKKTQSLKSLDYWKKKLEDCPTLTDLPYDFSRPAVFSQKGKTIHFNINPLLMEKLKHKAQSHGTTLYVLGLSALFVFLYKYTGKSDFCVGSPYANREHPGTDKLIGYFVQMLVLRQKLQSDDTWNAVIEKVAETTNQAFKHSDLSFEKLVEHLNPPRNASFNPFFQIGFSVEKATYLFPSTPELVVNPINIQPTSSRFDLYLAILEDQGGYIEYSSDLFKEETILRWLSHYQLLLENLVENETLPIKNMDILLEDEKRIILDDWNNTATDYPKECSIVDCFEQIARNFPKNKAIKHNGESICYEELQLISNQWARYLKEIGIEKGDFVGLSMDKSIDLICVLLAILKVGGIYVPIDKNYPESRKDFMKKDAQIKILIENKPDLKKFNKSSLNIHISATDLAYVNYTSGSTGNPKGVLIPHRGVVRLVKEPNWVNFSPHDKILQTSNISFDATTFEIWGALLNGGCICISPLKDFSPDEMGNFIFQEKISHVFFTARIFNLMVDFALDKMVNIKWLCTGGEAISGSHGLKAILALPDTKIVNGYGPTENTTFTTTFQINKDFLIDGSFPIGKPVSNSKTYILDSDLNPVPIGCIGELYTSGDGLATGYLNQKELTQTKFIPNKFDNKNHTKMYRTGDLVKYLADGNIVYVGRIDNQVKIRGFRIELGEIESYFRGLKNIPGLPEARITECVCTVWEEAAGDKQLVAYIEGTKEINEDILRKKLSADLPAYVHPNYIFLLEKFPVNAVGKIDKKALPNPTELLHKTERGAGPPATSTEEIVANIWSTVLNTSLINRSDYFFHIGGHSIKAAQVAAMASKIFNKTIPSNLLFKEPILKNYCEKIDFLLQNDDAALSKQLTDRDLFWIWRNKEISLDSNLVTENLLPCDSTQYTDPQAIFLTGATGFVGAFTLISLIENTKAKIYCLVKASSESDGRTRIIQTLRKYELKENVDDRIVIVLGDLEKDQLGISREQFQYISKNMDSIFHIGAYVNHTLPYKRLKAANVCGTIEVIRIAMTYKLKPLHFASTLAACDCSREIIRENQDINKVKKLFNGYAESKWVGEKILEIAKGRGLPVNIYRLSRVGGSSISGVCATGDFMWRTIQACLQIQLFPQIGLQENVTPVNFVADCLVAISKKPSYINLKLHLIHPKQFSYMKTFEILKSMGYNYEFTSYILWKQKLLSEYCKQDTSNDLSAIAPLFSELHLDEKTPSSLVDCTNFLHFLDESQIKIPSVDQDLFHRYIRYLQKIGYLHVITAKKRSVNF